MSDITGYIVFNTLDELVKVLLQMEMFLSLGCRISDYDVVVIKSFIAIRTYGREKSKVIN